MTEIDRKKESKSRREDSSLKKCFAFVACEKLGQGGTERMELSSLKIGQPGNKKALRESGRDTRDKTVNLNLKEVKTFVKY